ncbi:MAG TPA: metallophosphoesterase [Clostridia bacterium]|nr:metallophosphoesterase [Clostridia bacterium]
MKIFAIGDLHLPGNSEKPMDVFGEKWGKHFERVCDSWQVTVKDSDVVLIPGDISWALKLEDSADDLAAIARLNGKKVLLRGNHDYWWNSLAKVRGLLDQSMFAVQNDCIVINGMAFAGSRGWTIPESVGFSPAEDEKIYERELARLELSLSSVPAGAPIVGMLHYPPFNERRVPSAFCALFERFRVREVVYGHLHGKACKNAFEGMHNGVNYTLCSADHIGFSPKFILETE